MSGWKGERGTPAERGFGPGWKALAKSIRERDGHLCVPCRRVGRLTPCTAVDHIIPRASGGTDDPSNLQAICDLCHKVKTAADSGLAVAIPRLRYPPRIPVTLVCGPPGSGKAQYVRQHADAARDLILNLNELKAQLANAPIYSAAADAHLMPALAWRNAQLAELSGRPRYRHCWLIVGAPTGSERRLWRDQLHADRVVVLEVDGEECRRRIARDRRRRGQEWGSRIDAWWSRYSGGRDETVIRG